MLVELDKKTFEQVSALGSLAGLSESEIIKAMYHWLHDYYKGLNGSIGLDLKAVFDREQLKPSLKVYCTQNQGDCSTCSLKNYGRDCQNNKV